MKKKWWMISGLAAVLVIGGLVYWGYGLSRDREQIITYMNNNNQRAFYQLMDHVENMEVMLSKSLVSNSPLQRMVIFSDVWQESFAARENLAQIPITGSSMTRTATFLTQAGDFVWSLAKKFARGETIKAEDITKINELHTEAGYLAAELENIEKKAADYRLTWGEIKTKSQKDMGQEVNVPSGLENINKKMEDFPTLIYDGPFSDHIINRKPLGLTGNIISKEKAGTLARIFAEAGTSLKYRVINIENVNGIIPAFRVYLASQQEVEPSVTVDISKKGGHTLFMLNNRRVNKAAISSDKAVSLALSFLKSRNIDNMQPTYFIEQQNTGIVIFEYEQDGILIYPDLMKVKVAMDTGQIVGFEGTGFLINHHNRQLPRPTLSEKQALRKVNPNLKVTSKRLAVIPRENLEEVLVYEFKGSLEGDKFIVYINALTGDEEQIVKVIETNGGPLTM
ncbi:germination protein YpeB [Phosphitispora sp. TUW77]|uniref:germination protein YpeB n=1 Tax=Phosphitispora sp. TUW77 TaxID=3152361 RepID=UPI003AB5DBCD